jgi:hypothetical protein
VFVPQVVDRVVRADGATVIQYQPQVKNRVDTPPEILDMWKRGTYKAVNEPGGTAFGYATSEVMAIAGKTGTAQVAAKKAKKDQRQIRGWSPSGDHAWFAGVAPAENPEVAIVVLIEHGGPGGKVAGPVAKLDPRGLGLEGARAPARPALAQPRGGLRMATGEYSGGAADPGGRGAGERRAAGRRPGVGRAGARAVSWRLARPHRCLGARSA